MTLASPVKLFHDSDVVQIPPYTRPASRVYFAMFHNTTLTRKSIISRCHNMPGDLAIELVDGSSVSLWFPNLSCAIMGSLVSGIMGLPLMDISLCTLGLYLPVGRIAATFSIYFTCVARGRNRKCTSAARARLCWAGAAQNIYTSASQ